MGGARYENILKRKEVINVSISLDFTTLWTGANEIVNAIGPVYLYIAGFSFGFMILAAIVGAIFKFRGFR